MVAPLVCITFPTRTVEPNDTVKLAINVFTFVALGTIAVIVVPEIVAFTLGLKLVKLNAWMLFSVLGLNFNLTLTVYVCIMPF